MPRLTGWWDEIEGDVEKIAQTVARVVDPKFDNKLALGQMLREDPTKQQALVDMESINPGILDSLYGSKLAEQIKNSGTASTAARAETAGRNIAGKKAKDIVNPTVSESAALSKQGVKTALDIKQQETGIDAQEQQTDYYKYVFDQLKWNDALKNPLIKAEYDQIQKDRELYPTMALNDPFEMAKDFLEGNMDGQKLRELKRVSPEGYEMFNTAVRLLGENARQDRMDDRADRRLQAQMDNQDDILKRQVLASARSLAREAGLGGPHFNDLVNYLSGEPVSDPAIQEYFDNEQRVQRQKQILADIVKLQPLAEEYLNANGREREIRKQALEAGLRTVFGAPIIVREVDKGWFSKESKYLLPDGREVNGDELFRLANDPERFQQQLTLAATINAMDLATATSALEAWKARQTQVDGPTYQETFALLDKRIKQLSGSDGKEGRARR